jgi:hypothetical protein
MGRFGYCWVSYDSWNVPTGQTECIPAGRLYIRNLNWALMLVTGMDYYPSLGPAKPFCAVDWITDSAYAHAEQAVMAQECSPQLNDGEIGVITFVMLLTSGTPIAIEPDNFLRSSGSLSESPCSPRNVNSDVGSRHREIC